jgi:hypothetical protein
MTKQEHRRRAETERGQWLAEVFGSLNQYDRDLQGIPEHVDDVGPGSPIFATLMRATAYISQIEDYGDRIQVSKDRIQLRVENDDADEGEAWQTWTHRELQDFVQFNIVAGIVQGMIQNARIQYKPEDMNL